MEADESKLDVPRLPNFDCQQEECMSNLLCIAKLLDARMLAKCNRLRALPFGCYNKFHTIASEKYEYENCLIAANRQPAMKRMMKGLGYMGLRRFLEFFTDCSVERLEPSQSELCRAA
eukprot:scaffold565421_cov24-Prasinocladus_malaysianus.AAC.1